MKSIALADEAFEAKIEALTPFAAGKIGGTEGKALKFAYEDMLRMFRPNKLRRRMHSLYELSGVYPESKQVFYKFADYYAEKILPQIDYLAHWRHDDDLAIHRKLGLKSRWIMETTLQAPSNWWRHLSDKKIAVISPFSVTIGKQIPLLRDIWPALGFDLKPKNISVIKSPVYAHLSPPAFPDWFTSLDNLKKSLDETDYDILLIGAGAWSLPLTAHAKSRGKIGIHLGGELQLLFGIVGSRWEKRDVVTKYYRPEYWTSPLAEDTPDKIKNASSLFRTDCAYW